MKRFMLTVLVLCLSTVMSVGVGESGVFIEGIRGQGSHRSEPEASRSKYLKTYTGGFGVRDQGAFYHVFIDLRKLFDKPMLVKVEFTNPLDRENPIVEKGQILRGSQSLTLTKGPVRGLEIQQDYSVKVSIYDPENSDKPVDELTQKIRSYIDTTTAEVFYFEELQPRHAMN